VEKFPSNITIILIPIPNPDKISPKLEKDGVEKVKNKLAKGA